ncbi:MAG: patatin-like phospholipase family protein [Bacillota bacterium]
MRELVAANLRHVRDFADYRRPDLPESVRPVFLTAVNLADGKETIFAPPGTPARGEFRVCTKQSLAFAVHCSISIPGTFVPAACEPRPGCPCYGQGTQYYVDGGVRDFYPLTVPVRLAGARHILGVELGYAGMREDILAQGPAGLFGHVLEIMGHDQVEADYHDQEVAQAQVVTINPLIYDIGGFETAYIPDLIARGEAVAEECFRSLGLYPEAGREANLARLFPAGQRLFLYPAKGTAAFAYWLAHPIKRKGSVRSWKKEAIITRKA